MSDDHDWEKVADGLLADLYAVLKKDSSLALLRYLRDNTNDRYDAWAQKARPLFAKLIGSDLEKVYDVRSIQTRLHAIYFGCSADEARTRIKAILRQSK